MQLGNKSIIVTGGAHGIGRAYAEAIAREGGRVGILDLDLVAAERVCEGIRSAGGSATASEVDVADGPAVRAAVDRIATAFGGLDGLVNNAGMLNVVPISRVRFEEIPEAEWDRAFATHAKGTWNACRSASPYLRRNGGGSIVNIGSSTIFRANPTRAHYVASKAAIIGFSRVLARELGDDWIRVNVVCPGSTLSEEAPTPEIHQLRAEPISARALKRIQTPTDAVGTVLFLLSDESAFITGQTIVVDGGAVVH